MNEKKVKALRKEMRKYFGNPTTEVRKYQEMNNQRMTGLDKENKKVSFMAPGTLRSSGLRQLYQGTKVTVRQEGMQCK